MDWVGDTAEVVDPDTGELLRVYVFAGCLPYSNYLFAEGFYRTDEQAWIDAHAHMFSFFGGATPVLVPDNCKTAVSKNTKEALIVNEQYRRMSEHYGCAVVPARVRRPRDKASVEMGVGLIERQAMLALRGRRFMSLGEFNSALRTRSPPSTRAPSKGARAAGRAYSSPRKNRCSSRCRRLPTR